MAIQSLCTNDCIDEVIKEYSDMIYRLACSATQSKYHADDIFQEVFLRYISKERIFESEEHRKAWFIRVTVNCSKKLKSSAWFRKTVPLDDNLITTEIYEETHSELSAAVAALPQRYRTVIHLFYYEDLSVEQISKFLKINPSTIRSQLLRARTILKGELKGDVFYD